MTQSAAGTAIRAVTRLRAGSIRTTRPREVADPDRAERVGEAVRPHSDPECPQGAVALDGREVAPLASEGPPTILFEIFWTNQKRTQLIEAALQGTELPPEDYPIYVMVGAEGPWTPTGLAKRLEMPLTTLLFRVRRLEKRGRAERVENPDDRRSFLIQLTPGGMRLLRQARPSFRSYVEAVDTRLGADRVARLRVELIELREAIDGELAARAPAQRA